MRSVVLMFGAAAMAGCGTKTNVPGQSSHKVVRHVSSPKAVSASQALGAMTVMSDIQAFQMVTPQSGWLLTQNTLYHLTQGGREARAVSSSAIDNLVAVWTPHRVFTASAPKPHPGNIKVVIRFGERGALVDIACDHQIALSSHVHDDATRWDWLARNEPRARGRQ